MSPRLQRLAPPGKPDLTVESPYAPITIPPALRLLSALGGITSPMQPTSASSGEHIAARTRRKWGELGRGESMVASATSRCFGLRRKACCTKSSAEFENPAARGILLTVRHPLALGPIAGSRDRTMFEAVTAFFGVMSAGIFIAHAVDGYRSRL